MSFVQGIDVSRWQPTVDFEKVKAAGNAFVVIKASQASFADPKFATHWPKAKAAGLLRGAYHFLTEETAAKQIAIYLKTLGDDKGELPPVLDIEDPKAVNLPKYADIAHAWLVEVEKQLGRKPIIYTAAWYWNPKLLIRGKYPEWAMEYPLWVAAYPVSTGAPALDDLAKGKFKPSVPKSWTGWTLWQYSEKGRVDGVVTDGRPANTDLNIFGGSLEDMNTKLNLGLAAERLAELPSFTPAVSFALGDSFEEIEVGMEAPEEAPARVREALAELEAQGPARRPASKKVAKKAAAKKPAAKKGAKKAPARKSAVKKSARKKTAAKKSARKAGKRKK